MSNILVVDDEAGIRELLQEILSDEGHQVRLAENAVEARHSYELNLPDLVLLDIWMPDTDGITLLKEWSAQGELPMPVIMMSGHGTIDTAVEATKIGAYDFLEKPIALQKLLHTVTRALKQRTVQPKTSYNFLSFGRSKMLTELQERLQQLSKFRGAILLTGSPGAPFELAAKTIHPANSPWVTTSDLGWLSNNPSEFLPKAEHGTLFLGDISGLSKLEQRGLGLLVSKLEKFDVQLICYANKPLPRLVQDGLFDADLYQALSTVSLHLPDLVEFRDDIPEIAKQFLMQLVETKVVTNKSLDIAALNALRLYDWPFNWKELESTVRTIALTSLAETLSVEDVKRVLANAEPLAVPSASQPVFDFDQPLREARDAFEKLYFEHHLEKAAGNMSRIADTVGLERTHLYRKLKQLDIKFTRKPD